MDKIEYSCQNCGATFSGWQGKCTICDAWNSVIGNAVIPDKHTKTVSRVTKKNIPTPIDAIPTDNISVFSSGISELDHVLGQGFVPGAAILLGGEPGIGKSTLALQIAHEQAKHRKVLYVSGEESATQIHLRASRLGTLSPTLFVLTETNVMAIREAIIDEQPELVIIDSIQVLYHHSIPSVAGSVNQVRFCASVLIDILKATQTVGLFIGHITKDGTLAGPKVLEHLVDVILYLEGERIDQYRVLRSFKNRYSSTQEIGLFEMKSTGLTPVASWSDIVVGDAAIGQAGSVVSSIVEGTRSILVEVQALVVKTGYGMAKRTVLGVDANRANVMIAAIEKILGIKLADQDIILNIVGGIRTDDPALDLGIVLAILSSLHNKPVGPRIGICGEISLTGDIRSVKQAEKRVSEFHKMGFTHVVLPTKNTVLTAQKMGIQVSYVETLQDALGLFLSL